jgi:hypothetical protein
VHDDGSLIGDVGRLARVDAQVVELLSARVGGDELVRRGAQRAVGVLDADGVVAVWPARVGEEAREASGVDVGGRRQADELDDRLADVGQLDERCLL